MLLDQLIEALSEPAAYPFPAEQVQVRQTHISVVFLVGPYVYKIKKPLALGFLDFTTLERRRHFCEEEVRLNRRLAPDAYLGVVPVTRTETGAEVEGPGDVVEWAVKMVRLPEEATLSARLRRGELDAVLAASLARRVAAFHQQAEAGEHVSAFGRFDVVARNARENFEQSRPQVDVTISRPVYERLQALTEETLASLRPLIDERAKRGVPRDTHGDLHLDHIYFFPDRQPPNDWIAIDCIEFSQRFRYADPVSDVAFLVMDLAFHGRSDLGVALADAYFEASGDKQGRSLLSFYAAYRAAVRGKVEGMKSAEREIPKLERTAALCRSRGHWLLALGELEQPGRRPCLILMGGLPGTGKSTLAQGLAERTNLALIRSDVVRKELAGKSVSEPAASAYREGIYAPAWTELTYRECLRRAERLLWQGRRVVVDASFSEDRRRRDFLDLAARLALPALFILCRADREVVRRRISARLNDASDADWTIYEQAAKHWEDPTPAVREKVHVLSTSGTPEQSLSEAENQLRAMLLLE